MSTSHLHASAAFENDRYLQPDYASPQLTRNVERMLLLQSIK